MTAFGKMGAGLWRLARGEDGRMVTTSREAKSISREVTFPRDISDPEQVRAVLLELADDVALSLRRHGYLATKVTLKVRYGNFDTVTRQGTLPAPACLTMPIYPRVLDLLARVDLRGRGILLGVGSAWWIRPVAASSAFLRTPAWCGKKKLPRPSTRWRPGTGGGR